MRLDKYLKISRLIKRRTLAKEASEGDRVLVNGLVAKPSKEVKVGDVITVREKSQNLEVLKSSLAAQTHTPGFVEVNADKMEGKFVRLPERSELNQEINESLIVEYYNRLG